MKTICIRIDEKVVEIIDRNAAQQGIKPTRYVRSLIEKGLVLDHQIQGGTTGKHAPMQDTTLWFSLAEFLIENVMLARILVRKTVQTPEEHKEILQVAAEKAKQYLDKHKNH